METKAARRPLDATAFGIMLVLCICWGFQQVAIKLAAPDVTTVMQIAIRSGFTAVVLGVYLVWKNGLAQFRDGSLVPGIGIGILFAMEFLFIAWALNFTYASHVSVFVYTSPIWAALGLHLRLPDERMSRMQWLGVLVAFVGVGIAFAGNGAAGGAASNVLLGDFLALLGGASWGLTTVVIRTSSISEAPAAKTLFYQVAVAAILMLIVALVTGATHVEFTQTALLSLGFQSIVVTLATFLIWFWLLKRYLATRLGILSFMTPLFGVASAVIVLHDPVDASFAIGALLVLAGIVIVNGGEFFARKAVVEG
ncbi:membrane protein [Youhaiella tibetensis]|uniref:DMT family transporter n=1 Tax=Paradevosia tibetensis TaxID=1447062 RepID=A0A5B9DL19_9HYPH|nr:DMT family transporter [Youhaiella tibetensis]QEE19924.1 DMT family transporter [Youhaiella tibetensis]GGF28660.1 membrane protein [Youhaiella tibetensis]